jgi:hypothetical protein
MSNEIETSLRDSITQTTDKLKSSRILLDSFGETKLSTETCQSLADVVKEMLSLLQSAAARLSEANFELDIPSDIEIKTSADDDGLVEELTEEEENDDIVDLIFAVKINDDIMGYVHSEEEAIALRDKYANILNHSLDATYDTRSELSDDATTITFYGRSRFLSFITRWERFLSSVSYECIERLE